ncbi:MerR family transcriptional regulator [Clostridium estertheticum]|uniref:MerR family transcriptional regulator n=1 Tax=Clostridium estertheticum TaxID=238834 RepID=UPI001C0DC7C7|nr:MerR family transcriptional regulator [Clostridium estertheticum]MBU3073068.1 methyltransferase domain-containing protein [Clostridium estertheticum]MBU3162895.1 methyltransferase domain-containing protein [Clostridium estertheticum]
MKISEFAKRAGVTVKTLLYYDKIGLLKPSQKTDCGYRIYCEKDFLILQQITTLKFIGLSLSEIRKVLHETEANLENMIIIQKKALEEKKKHIESVITVFNKAENQIKENGFLEVYKLIDIIKITNMENKVIEQYKTDENLNLRGNLHIYNTNKTDWNTWCFNQMKIPTKARILELGCGTGELWSKNSHNINEEWTITLSDFSKGMLSSTKNRLDIVDGNFLYEQINAQNIPYEDESFDVVIARHMLYFVPDITKAISEIKRVLVKGGLFYATTNSGDAMAELNELVKKFDCSMGLHDNGMCNRFDLECGQLLIKEYFSEVKVGIFEGKIIVDNAEPVVAYKASSIKGSSVLVGEKKREFTKYVGDYIKEKRKLAITTKSCIFKAKK